MSIDQNKEIVHRAAAAIGRGDITGFMADASDDFTFTLMNAAPETQPIQGKQKFIAILTEMFGKKLVNSAVPMTVENMIAEGNYVVEQAKGTSKTLDGRDYNNTYCRVWRIENGKIKALQEYMDTELARKCLWE